MTLDHSHFIKVAYEQALKGYNEGGLPIGAAMVNQKTGEIISTGRNRRIQNDDPIAHGEMDCIKKAGRRPNYKGITLYTTLSPCMMCSGTIVQFGISEVVIGENSNFEGNIDFLKSHNVKVTLLNDLKCKELMSKFIEENQEIWNEDIAKTD